MTLGKRRLGESLFTLLGKLTATKENLQNYQRAYKEREREREGVDAYPLWGTLNKIAKVEVPNPNYEF